MKPLPSLARIAPLVPLVAFAPGAARAQSFAVGHTSIAFIDPARGGRSVPTEVYYPADTPGDDVPVADGVGPLPVVGFGHGFLIAWSAYEYLWDALVPTGTIVALPRTETGLLPDHAELGRDLAFVVTALQHLGDDPGSPFFGRVGATSALAGHSMGGGASILGAAEAPYPTAVFNLAAAETNPSAIAAAALVPVPVLLFAGTDDCVTPVDVHQRPIYEALGSSCAALLQVVGGSHCQFAGASLPCSLGEIGCPQPGIDAGQQHQVVLEFLVPWLALWLKGDTAAGAAFQAQLGTDPRVVAEQDCPAVDAPGIAPAAAGPARLVLAPASPNPFRDATRLGLAVGRGGRVRVDVVDVRGRRVRTLLDRTLATGSHPVTWDGRGGTGARLPAGMYFVRASTDGGEASTVRVSLLR